HAPPGGEQPCDGDEGTGIDQLPQSAFGPSWTITIFYPPACGAGRKYNPIGQRSSIPVDGRLEALAAGGKGQFLSDMTANGTHIRVLAMGIRARGALALALQLTDVDKALRTELLLLVVICAAGIAVAALLGILVARTALAPIARFTRQTEQIAANPEILDRQRLEETGGDELARLARTFNDTLDALERSVQSQRNLVADASHELRTPIASIRANLQLMRDEALLSPEDREALRADVIEELDELTALVGDVVELARGTKPVGPPADVRLDQVVEAGLDRARRRAPELSFQASIEPTLVRGEGDRIARAVGNLLDNAIKYGADGGTIEVGLRDGTLTVRDHGRGFHEEDLPLVFDRFHRARDARGKPGSGLGLAIVRQAAEAHGGFVRAANAPDGGAVLRIGFGEPIELEQSTVA
ncbi:MAG: HAMP domain-containing sensor histidine kinase, partial [Solirubrobacteraceae bacterium]